MHQHCVCPWSQKVLSAPSGTLASSLTHGYRHGIRSSNRQEHKAILTSSTALCSKLLIWFYVLCCFSKWFLNSFNQTMVLALFWTTVDIVNARFTASRIFCCIWSILYCQTFTILFQSHFFLPRKERIYSLKASLWNLSLEWVCYLASISAKILGIRY